MTVQSRIGQMDNTMPDTRQSRPAPETAPDKAATSPWRRYLPIAVIAAGLAAGYAAGLQDYLSLSVFAEQRESIKAFVAERQVLSILGYFVLYTAAVAFAFPAASVLTIFAGFVFGWWVAGILTVFAATLGATAIFLAARSAFGDVLRRRAGPFAAKSAVCLPGMRSATCWVLEAFGPWCFTFLIEFKHLAPAIFSTSGCAPIVGGDIPSASFPGKTLAYFLARPGLDSVHCSR